MRPGKNRRWLIGGALVALVALALAAAAWWQSGPSAEERQVVYSVPPGTVARMATGEHLDVLPATIALTLGKQDILVIRNDDSQPIQVGPFKIEPGQRFVQQYYNRGTFDLICTIHENERLRIIIE